MKKFIPYTMILMPLLLTSCSYISSSAAIRNRNKEYLSATSIPPIRTPPGISSDAFNSSYPVSDRNYPAAEKNVSIVPPGVKG